MLQFHSWNKVEAGHYVYKTDDGYTAVVTKWEDRTKHGHWAADWEPVSCIPWYAKVTTPSGETIDRQFWHGNQNKRLGKRARKATMKNAREWALRQIMEARA